MKNFRVQIRAYGHASDFTVVSEDNAESIEKSILDKIGKMRYCSSLMDLLIKKVNG